MTQTGLNIDFKKFSDLNNNMIDIIYQYENIWKTHFKIVLTQIKFNYVMFQIRRLGYLYVEYPISQDELSLTDREQHYTMFHQNKTYGQKMLIGCKSFNTFSYDINKQNVLHLSFRYLYRTSHEINKYKSFVYSLELN
jgi:hypothetical protein